MVVYERRIVTVRVEEKEGWKTRRSGYIRDTKGNSLIFPSFRRGILSMAFPHPRSQERKLLLVLESGISSWWARECLDIRPPPDVPPRLIQLAWYTARFFHAFPRFSSVSSTTSTTIMTIFNLFVIIRTRHFSLQLCKRGARKGGNDSHGKNESQGNPES